MPRKVETEAQENMAALAAELLAGAPEPMHDVTEEAVEIAAQNAEKAQEAQPYELDPQDELQILFRAYEQLGQKPPFKLIDAIVSKHKPIMPSRDPRNLDDYEEPSPEEFERRQKEARRKANMVANGQWGGQVDKKAIYLAALQNCIPVVIFNDKDRKLLVNKVNIHVPKGQVEVPSLVAELIRELDSFEQYAQREKDRASSFLTAIDEQGNRKGSVFKESKVEAFRVF
jgi:hypothetical protein